MKKDSQHVSPHRNGGWSVRKTASVKATKVFDKQGEAIKFGKTLARKKSSDLYVHSRDGLVREKFSFSADPFSAKGD